MMVVGIVGLPASGKGEFSRVAREMGIPVVVMGDAIRQAVTDARKLPTDKNLGQMGDMLRAEKGMDAVASVCIPVIERQISPLVVVDGIRGDAEVKCLRNHFPNFYLVGIEASFALRLQRLKDRKRSDDSSREIDLQDRDARERAWGLDEALLEADCTLSNEGDLDTFREKTAYLIARLRREES
ncbi:MAG: flagellar hook-basal body complex protein FliE [Methanomicrobiales archaeon]|nr:flagellar hook-basal body complex protein FliE [Methanomicrobiales archaeon]